MPNDDTEAPEDLLEDLGQALQAYATDQEHSGQPVLVTNALVMWEQVRFDEDGRPWRCISYCVPTADFTLSGSLGLLEAAGEYLRRDVLGARPGPGDGSSGSWYNDEPRDDG